MRSVGESPERSSEGVVRNKSMEKARQIGGDKAAREIARLREEIRGHERRYYVADNPTISDAEFDALMNELKVPPLEIIPSPNALEETFVQALEISHAAA